MKISKQARRDAKQLFRSCVNNGLLDESRVQQAESRAQSFGRHALAALVLLVCAWLLLHVLFHVVIVVATIIAVVVAIIGAIWALRVLF